MHQICVPLNLGSRLMWTKDKLCDEPNKWFSCESFATNTIGMDSNNTRFFKIIGGPEHLFRKCVLNFLYSVCILLELTSKYWNILVKSQRMGSQLWSGQRASKILVQRRLCWERNLKFGPKSAPEVTYFGNKFLIWPCFRICTLYSYIEMKLSWINYFEKK